MIPPINVATVAELADQYGTPLYVISGQRIRERVAEFRAALPPGGRLLYSVKANPAPGVIRLLADLGLDFDVCSPGDVALAFAAGCPPERLSYVGCGVSQVELASLVTRGVPFIADSLDQLQRFARLRPGGSLGVRLNPGLRSGFHPDVQAGRRESKFGIQRGAIDEALAVARRSGCFVVGLHAHVGSEVSTHDTHVRILELLLEHAARVPTVKWVNIGGGWAVPIRDETSEDPGNYDLAAFASETASILAAFEERHGRTIGLRVEPGSYLVMDAGCLATRVTEIKPVTSADVEERRFLFTDASTDLIYSAGAYRTRHPVWSVRQSPAARRFGWVVAGPLMQAGDILAEDPWLPPEVNVGDILVFGMCGAYKMVRASNFNGRTRPAEVLLDHDKVVVLRDRETTDDLLGGYRSLDAPRTEGCVSGLGT